MRPGRCGEHPGVRQRTRDGRFEIQPAARVVASQRRQILLGYALGGIEKYPTFAEGIGEVGNKSSDRIVAHLGIGADAGRRPGHLHAQDPVAVGHRPGQVGRPILENLARPPNDAGCFGGVGQVDEHEAAAIRNRDVIHRESLPDRRAGRCPICGGRFGAAGGCVSNPPKAHTATQLIKGGMRFLNPDVMW